MPFFSDKFLPEEECKRIYQCGFIHAHLSKPILAASSSNKKQSHEPVSLA